MNYNFVLNNTNENLTLSIEREFLATESMLFFYISLAKDHHKFSKFTREKALALLL
jgi:hypothetical protein